MRKFLTACAVVSLLSCAKKEPDAKAAAQAINATMLLQHIRTLASDEFEGRAPGSKGEDLTVAFLEKEFRRIGAAPGNPDGTYVQKVPLAGFTSKAEGGMTIAGKRIALTPFQDFVGVSRRFTEKVEVNDADVVFVGYGVVAPEYGWDDYKDVDVKGKVIVMLINDPALPDEKMFRGKAMTYYGRWTYKYEIATAKGAAAAVIVHETGPAGYPFEVVTGSWGRENFDLQRPDNNMSRVPVEGWVSLDKAKEIFAAAGMKFEDMKAEALKKEFRPVPLKGKASFTVANTLRKIESRNVVAKIEGSDPKLKDEYVVYTAHWDHLGKDETRDGDQIFNGAVDNASGTAGLLELARAFQALDPKPKRSVLFLAVTAEEKGLLGAAYYAENPLYPLTKTLANLNMDSLNQWGRTSDIVVVGLGNSTLDDTLAEAAKEEGRTLRPDPEPEKGFYYRSDHFEFAKRGVPALYTDSGEDYVGRPPGYSQAKRDEYTNNDYHKPSDEPKPDWDLTGAVDDLRLLFGAGYRVAQAQKWPEWKPGAEFKALREKSLKP
jgi:Zn-dependent M28 family amino/carboxypeptidase